MFVTQRKLLFLLPVAALSVIICFLKERELMHSFVRVGDDIHWEIDDSWPPSSVISNVTKGGKNRVVVASFNCQNLQFADNWANSLLSHGSHNFILVPLDKTTEEILQQVYPSNTVPMLPGVADDELNEPAVSNVRGIIDHSAKFGTEKFKRLTAARPRMLDAFLRKNVTVFYNDVDIVWKTNVWDDLDAIVMEDTDGVDAIFQVDGSDTNICTCIIFMVPGQSNFRLLENWQDNIDTEKFQDDQRAFNKALKTDHGVKFKYLPEDLFPWGGKYFEQNEREGVHLVHANWMIGQTNKTIASSHQVIGIQVIDWKISSLNVQAWAKCMVSLPTFGQNICSQPLHML